MPYKDAVNRRQQRILWAKENPERRRELNRLSARRHQAEEKNRLKVKAWRKKNPQKARVLYRNRRARKIASTGTHTAQDICDLYQKQKGNCVACRNGLAGKYHVDHVTPLVRGGTNDRSNLQLLCVRCNTRKGAKDPVKWRQEMGELL